MSSSRKSEEESTLPEHGDEALVAANSYIKEAFDILKREEIKVRKEKEAFDEVAKKMEHVHFSKMVVLNVGGHFFSTSLATLTKDPGSMLHAMFSGRFDTKPSEDGSYFIDRDGTHFRYVLNYLRTSQLIVPKDEIVRIREELLSEAEFYQVEGIIRELTAKPFKDSVILSSDQRETLMNWLKETQALNNSRDNLFFGLIYRASRDGWDAADFHSRCNYKGPTVTVIKSGEYIFGGYTEQQWEHVASAGYRRADDSFLFSLVNPSGLPPTKMPLKAGEEEFAIHCDNDCGPVFGRGADLSIEDAPNSSECSADLDNSYECPPDEDSNAFLTAGVADEDMLDEFLVGRRELDHGQSSTMDVRRFLNVKYHQASVGKFKKVAAVSTIAFVLIIVMVLTFGSAPTKKIAIKRLPASPEPKEPGAEKQRHSFVLATNPDMPINLALKCNTCALVSSSGMLLGSNAGSQIDSADCVFRLNSAPTLGYERDVGSKTTIRVVSVTGLKSLITDDWQKTLASFEDLDYMILLGPEELLCENCTLTNLYRKFAGYLHNTEVLRVRQETYQKVKQESRKLGITYGRQDFPISTRFYTMSLVQQVCHQIRVFGMELENPCHRSGTIPVFYWAPDSWRHNCLGGGGRVQVLQRLKRLRQEREIFNSWARQYHVEFFYPSQKVT